MAKDALVSVCIAAYNHQDFVLPCIESVLSQTFEDFELVIIDDASTDRTAEIIARCADSRISFFRHELNRGLSVTLNHCFERSRGKYFCLLGSDDLSYPERLECQTSFLQDHPDIGLVFSRATIIDETGNVIAPAFDGNDALLNPSRDEWLAELFCAQNRLHAPTAMIRREVIDRVGNFDPRLLQTQDMDLWIRIALEFDIHVLPESLTFYRQLGQGANLSANSPEKQARLNWEIPKVLNRFRAIQSRDRLVSIFPAARELADKGYSIDAMLAICALGSELTFVRNFGLDLLYEVLSDQGSEEALATIGFGYSGLSKAATRAGVFAVSADRWALKQAENWQAAHANLYGEYEKLRVAYLQLEKDRDKWHARSV